ncbi:PepSY domain-containing protein [Brevundimonas sp.]|uniref:PepSY domain-containing protein n=1 Tax=Brevundimonas sp. TaxID=1871086 RepID=UPI0027379513|nr:PepSY domain-containing protein [Brevundimonas sp.]MDP3801754.1 PepSY domain-containing protein [Brevundimonas sp.]
MTHSSSRPLMALAAIAALLSFVPTAPAYADSPDEDDHVAAREALRRGEILPLARILSIVAARVPGDVIDVELERKDNRWRYEVKVLTSTGRVREVKLNARDGAILEIEDD